MRVHLFNVVVGQTELRHHAGPKGLDHHVALGGHLLCDLKRLRRFHVEGDGTLTAVERD